MSFQRVLPFLAALVAACGTTATSHYGEPVDSGRGDAADAREGDGGAGDASALPDVVAPDDAATGADAAPDAPLHGPPYPIILHHGFAGFRQIGPLSYFYNVADDLRSRGEVVYEAQVTPFATPQARAHELAAFVDQVLAETHSAKVVIIGHSQGGLDPRYMVSSLGYGDRVALLATVATPHRGTKVADAILGLIPGISNDFLNAVTTLLGVSVYDVRGNEDLTGAIAGLTERDAVAFNASNPDDPRVTYWSWTGRSNDRTGVVECADSHEPNDPLHVDGANALLWPFAVLLEQGDPITHVNDGLVEVQSAKWGVWMGCVPADHFDEVGQIAQAGPVPDSGFDHIAFYRHVAQRAREAGF